MKNLVYVHISKTAGTSFFESLKYFFKNNLLEDRNNNIGRLNVSNLIKDSLKYNLKINELKSYKCIAGHFLPIKYKLLFLDGWKFITWIRNPVERLISHYFHIQRKKNETKPNSIAHYTIANNLTLEEFCTCKQFLNYYQRFFYQFDIENFFFIGITENYKEEMNFLSKNFFENSLPYLHLNKNKYDIAIDKNLRIEIESLHKKDMDLYHSLANKTILDRCNLK